MRTIKFRGKLVDNGKWVYGDFYRFRSPSCEVRHHITELGIVYGVNEFEVIPETVGQFTGKKDDGEDDLYDGDIIRFGCGRTATGAISWSEEHCAWIVKEVCNKNEFMLSDCFDDFIEKIGNIHDNPELLEMK